MNKVDVVFWFFCALLICHLANIDESLEKNNSVLNNIDASTVAIANNFEKNQNDSAHNANQELLNMWVKVQNNSEKSITDLQQIDLGEHQWYKQHFKGIISGNLDPFGFSGTIASFAYDLSAEQMVQQVLTYFDPKNKYEPISQIYDMNIDSGMTLSRTDSDSTADKYFEFQRARARRMFEQQSFVYMAQKTVPNLTASEIAWMWNVYQMQRPYADAASKIPNPVFLNTWHDYVTPEAFATLRKTGQFKPTSPPPLQNYVLMREPDGKLYDVPENKVDLAISKYKFKKVV